MKNGSDRYDINRTMSVDRDMDTNLLSMMMVMCNK